MKRSKILSTAMVCGLLALGGCNAMGGSKSAASHSMAPRVAAPTKGPANQTTYTAALTAAQASEKKADSVGGEWRDTGQLIKDSQAAAEKGDFQAAIKLADEARFQGEMGFLQAVSQKSAGNPAYLTQ